MAQNNVKITVDKEYLISTLLFLGDKVEDCYKGETDRVIDSLIQQIEAGTVEQKNELIDLLAENVGYNRFMAEFKKGLKISSCIFS